MRYGQATVNEASWQVANIVGPSAFLNEFGVKNERVRILHWLDRHGGAMALSDVIDASAEPDLVVMHKVAGFVNDGLVRCDVDLRIDALPEISKSAITGPFQVELTDQGRALLKYA